MLDERGGSLLSKEKEKTRKRIKKYYEIDIVVAGEANAESVAVGKIINLSRLYPYSSGLAKNHSSQAYFCDEFYMSP